MDRQRADLPLDPRRLRNDDPNHRRGGYGRDRSPRSRSRIYLISPRGTTVPRQRVRPTLNLLFFFLLLLSPSSFPIPFRPPCPPCPQLRGSNTASSPPNSPPPPPAKSTRCGPLSLSILGASASSPLPFRSTYIHVFVRECDHPGIPMLIKRNTDPRYLSHAWRRSAALRRLPDILSPTTQSRARRIYL